MAGGYIEHFPYGDVGIIIACDGSEVSVKLNENDFPKVLGELIKKAKRMGLYQCDCEHDKQEKKYPACNIKKQPNPKTHGNADADCES